MKCNEVKRREFLVEQCDQIYSSGRIQIMSHFNMQRLFMQRHFGLVWTVTDMFNVLQNGVV